MNTITTTTSEIRPFENGIIESYDLKFTGPSGQQGDNFVFEFMVKTGRGNVIISTNPRKIPQLLKLLEVRSLKDIIGMPIMVETAKGGESRPKYIRNFISQKPQENFPVNEAVYFGSDLYVEYKDEKYRKLFLPEEEYKKKKPPLGKKPDWLKEEERYIQENPLYYISPHTWWNKNWMDFYRRYNVNEYEVGDKPSFDSGIR